MWVKNLVKFVLVLQIVLVSSRADPVEVSDDTELASLPNIWEDEVVSQMVREVLAGDLAKELQHKRARRQHKRDVQATASSSAAVAPKAQQTTRKASTTAQKTKKPTKVVTTGSKTKIRVTSATSTAATKATVKPGTKPIVTNSGTTGSINGALSTLKAKVRSRRSC
jgi:FKBP-type peptidyl-prolyl cis-trans isomerase